MSPLGGAKPITDEHRRVEAWQVARAFDVPPWVLGARRPRFWRLRWALRRVWPIR